MRSATAMPSGDAAEPAGEAEGAAPRSRRRLWIVLSSVVVLVVVLGAAAWVGVRGWMAKGELEKAGASSRT